MGTTYERRRGTLYNDRITFFGNVMALLVHTMFLIIFWRLDGTILLWSNLISVTYYSISFYFVHKRWYGVFFAGLFIEVVYNAIISTIVLGWDANMHYFILMMAYGVFFVPSVTKRQRLFTTALTMVMYSLLFLNVTSGVQPLPSTIEQALGLFCILTTIMMLAGLSFIFESAVVEVTDELEYTNECLQTIASTDGLTGLLNRMTGHARIAKGIEDAAKAGVPYAVILADIDNFKSFNERYGHDCGDLVIRQVSNILSRSEGICVRWGGEEFLLFLTGLEEDEIIHAVEHLRRQIDAHEIIYNEERLHVTMTFGIAHRHRYDSIDVVTKDADNKLRAGKRNGKNQVVLSY